MEEKKDVQRPVEVRQQTADEVRKRLRNQGKLKSAPKKEGGGVRELGDEEALVKAAERHDRVERESKEGNKLVRPLNKKDIALRLAAQKRRDLEKEGTEKPGRVLTKEDIEGRSGSDGEAEESDEKCPECGQIDEGQELHGEYPCPECGLPTVNDLSDGADKTEPPEVVEIFAKDIVSFKDDDGEVVTGKVKRVMSSKGEAIIDTDDAVYTVSCKDLTKEPKEEK